MRRFRILARWDNPEDVPNRIIGEGTLFFNGNIAVMHYNWEVKSPEHVVLHSELKTYRNRLEMFASIPEDLIATLEWIDK